MAGTGKTGTRFSLHMVLRWSVVACGGGYINQLRNFRNRIIRVYHLYIGRGKVTGTTKKPQKKVSQVQRKLRQVSQSGGLVALFTTYYGQFGEAKNN